MPNRILRESILDSEPVNSLTPEAEVFYRRLISAVDDFGRFDARPAVLRSRLYPLQLKRVRESNVVRWLAECEKVSLIRLYEIGCNQYLTLHKLGEPRAKASKYPEPPSPGERTRDNDLRADARTCAHVRPYSDSLSSANALSESNTPLTPQGGRRQRKREKEIAPAELPPIPANLDTPAFREAWNDFLEFRKEMRKKVTPRSAAGAFNKIGAWGVDNAIVAIRDSIANGWQGLFHPKQQRKPKARDDGFRNLYKDDPDDPTPETTEMVRGSVDLPPGDSSGP